MTITDQFPPNAWVDTKTIARKLWGRESPTTLKKTERWLQDCDADFPLLKLETIVDEHSRQARMLVARQIIDSARKHREAVLFAGIHRIGEAEFLVTNDGRNARRWMAFDRSVTTETLELALQNLLDTLSNNILLLPHADLVAHCRHMVFKWRSNQFSNKARKTLRIGLEIYPHSRNDIQVHVNKSSAQAPADQMSHLDRLEAESIHIIREVIAEANNPAMLYSVGKDSAVMLHLARKAFYPSPPPFPLLHVDTRWKFQAMYDFRDYMAQDSGMELLVHINPEGERNNVNPFDHGSALHTDIMKTQGLKQALDLHQFDAAFGGARRDEEKSRAKERVFSFRTSTHRWDAKNQRPELWKIYNGHKKPGESIRIFPLSNWTELDIWQYIYREQIPIVPLYFASERPVVERDDMLIMVDDDRFRLHEGEKIEIRKVRFRTLGCYPLTGAVESEADDLASILLELLTAKTSERQGRSIDSDSAASMEKKKEEGYF